jgi:hypothetical protein
MEKEEKDALGFTIAIPRRGRDAPSAFYPVNSASMLRITGTLVLSSAC